jgi:AcrR family transcriptional regulator
LDRSGVDRAADPGHPGVALEIAILEKVKLRPKKKAGRTRRTRRSTEEIIDRLMEAACEEFERNGYAGTTTAAIARKARVAEALILSHFGSKAKLFQDSIFKPLNRHFLDFCTTHLVDAGDEISLRQESQRYIAELRQFLQRHSKMLVSLVVTQMYTSDNVEGVSRVQGLHDYFSRAAAVSMKRLAGKPKIDPKLMTRVSFATLLACVIFKDWLFPEGLASEEEISAAIGDFVLDGVNANDHSR